MMSNLKKIALTASLAGFFVWIILFLAIRIKTDAAGKSLMPVYSLDDIKELCLKENYPPDSALKRLSSLGLKTILLKNETFPQWLLNNSITAGFSPSVITRLENDAVVLSMPPVKAEAARDTLAKILKKDIVYARGRNTAEIALDKNDYNFLSASMFGINPEEMQLIKSNGMNCAAEIFVENKTYRGFDPDLFDSLIFYDEAVRYVLIRGKRMAAYPRGTGNFARYLAAKTARIVYLEFYRQEGLRETARNMLNFVVPAHELFNAEGNFVKDAGRLNARLFRAVNERSVNMVLMRPFADAGVEENFAYIRDVLKTAKKSGLEVKETLPFYRSWAPFVKFRIVISFVLASVIPIISFFALIFAVRTREPDMKAVLLAFSAATFVSVAGGIFVYSILSSQEFILRVYHFQGVKLSFLIPLAVISAVIINVREWRFIWNEAVKVKHIVIFGGSLLLLYAAVSRTDNLSPFVLPYEGIIRDWLDKLFGVRPRFKEFLIGHPLLITGLWMWVTRGGLNEYENRIGRFLVCAGFIGQINIVNTFLHPHTPVIISLARTSYGLLAGLFFAALLIVLLKYALKMRFRFNRDG